MSEIATINIDKKTIEGIVERQMQAAIITHLGAVKDDLLQKVVEKMLTTKVNSDGKEGDYRSDTPLIEYLAKKKIHECAKEALNKFLDSQLPDIEKRVLAELNKQKGLFAKMAVESMANAVKTNFNYNFKMEITEKRNY